MTDRENTKMISFRCDERLAEEIEDVTKWEGNSGRSETMRQITEEKIRDLYAMNLNLRDTFTYSPAYTVLAMIFLGIGGIGAVSGILFLALTVFTTVTTGAATLGMYLASVGLTAVGIVLTLPGFLLRDRARYAAADQVRLRARREMAESDTETNLMGAADT